MVSCAVRILLIALIVQIPSAAGAQDLFIKNGTLLTVTQGTIAGGDILIRGGRIAAIGRDLRVPAGARIVDATDLYVMPGLIDSHTHIGLTATNEMGDVITSEVTVRDILNDGNRRAREVSSKTMSDVRDAITLYRP